MVHLDLNEGKSKYQTFNRHAYVYLKDYVSTFSGSDELRRVLEYTLLGSGKLFRPVLIAAIAEAVGVDFERISKLQLAVELVHASSLIHDDLPCLDDDDIRRGKPSCHKVFGEGLSLLAGDYLLSSASKELLSMDEDPQIVSSVAWLMNDAICQMCEGQILDLEIRKANNIKDLGEDGFKSYLEDINLKKTGALIKFSLIAPLHLTNSVSNEEVFLIERFAKNLSILFQLCDDILDSKHDTKTDDYREINYVDVLGLDQARRYADNLVQDSIDSISFLEERGDFLKYLVRFVRSL